MAAAEQRGRHVVFLFQQGAGHVLPTLPLVAALTARGVQVTYFTSEEAPPLREAVVAAGAELRSYRRATLDSEDRMVQAFCPTLPPLLEDLRTLQPLDVLLYDPFYPAPVVVGQVLKVPTVALVVNTGPGCSEAFESEQYAMAFEGVRTWLRKEYSIDLFDFGIPMSSWYSQTLNVVLTSEEFFEGPANDKQRLLFGHAPFHCVGSLVNPSTTRRPPVKDFTLDAIEAERAAGKKVVLLSLGTAITGLMWARPCPDTKSNDDGTQVEGKALGQMTGNEIANFIWKIAIVDLGGVEELVVVMAVGEQPGVLESLSLPSNFYAFRSVAQLDLLPLCSAFITHGGMGSTMEALAFRVPLVVIPIFGDQVANAENAAKANFGVSFRYPLATLRPGALGKAIQEVSSPDNLYKDAVRIFAMKMETEGGAAKAIDKIFTVLA